MWATLVIWIYIIQFRVLRSKDVSADRKLIACVVVAAITGSLVQSFFSVASKTLAVQAVFYFIIALGSVQARAKPILDVGGSDRLSFTSSKSIKGLFPKTVICGVLISLAVLSFIPIYRYLRSEIYFQHVLLRRREDPLKQLELSERWDPGNVYPLYTQLSFVRNDPVAVLRVSERIEGLVPGYQDVAWYRGFAFIGIGDYLRAIEEFKRQIGYDRTDIQASVHLMATYTLIGVTSRVLSVLEDFFLSQHRAWLVREDLIGPVQNAEIIVSGQAQEHGFERDGDGIISRYIVSRSKLLRAITSLLDPLELGYLGTLENIYRIIARTYDQMEYGQVANRFYRRAGAMQNIMERR